MSKSDFSKPEMFVMMFAVPITIVLTLAYPRVVRYINATPLERCVHSKNTSLSMAEYEWVTKTFKAIMSPRYWGIRNFFYTVLYILFGAYVIWVLWGGRNFIPDIFIILFVICVGVGTFMDWHLEAKGGGDNDGQGAD